MTWTNIHISNTINVCLFQPFILWLLNAFYDMTSLSSLSFKRWIMIIDSHRDQIQWKPFPFLKPPLWTSFQQTLSKWNIWWTTKINKYNTSEQISDETFRMGSNGNWKIYFYKIIQKKNYVFIAEENFVYSFIGSGDLSYVDNLWLNLFFILTATILMQALILILQLY